MHEIVVECMWIIAEDGLYLKGWKRRKIRGEDERQGKRYESNDLNIMS